MPTDFDSVAARWLSALQDCLQGALPVAEFIAGSADLLNGLPLYPPDVVMKTGLAAGDRLDKSPESAISIVLAGASSPVREVRAVIAAAMARLARYQPAIWSDIVKLLLNDDDWEVRDLAARCFDSSEYGDGAPEFHLGFVCETVTQWIQDPGERLRRAAALSLLGYAQRHPEFRPRLLTMLEPLLDDEREYVQASHAAALRALGRTDPDLILDHIQAVIDRTPAAGAATFTLALQHSWAKRHPARREQLLNRIAAANVN